MILRHAARLVVGAGLLGALLMPRGALAQDDATVEMARQRFKEGVGFFDQRQYEKARLAFLQAYALKPHPSILLNLAQSELRAGHPDDASLHFSEYLRTNTEASEAEKQEAELGFAASKSKVAEVTLTVDAPGAQVSVDGNEKGVAPLATPLYLMPGTHSVEARSGDKRATRSVTVSAGQATTLNLAVKAGGAAAAPPPPAAESENEPLPEKGAKPEAEPEEEPAEEPAEPTAEASVSTGGREPFFTWLVNSPGGLALAIVGGVGLAGGVGFAVWSGSEYANADDVQKQILGRWDGEDKARINRVINDPGHASPPASPNTVTALRTAGPCALPDAASPYLATSSRAGEYKSACLQYRDYADSGDSKKTIAIASAVVGGIGIVGTAVYYFVDSKPSGSATSRPKFQARVVPVVTPETRGVGVIGRF